MDEKDFVLTFNRMGSIKGTAQTLGCSEYRVRKILSSEGVVMNKNHKEILKLNDSGLNCDEIARKLCLSKKIVASYLPAVKPYYKINPSVNARRIIKCRNKKKNRDTA